MDKQQISLTRVKEWLQRYGWKIIGDKTYTGYDILADKDGVLKKIEVKYRSVPNITKGTVDLTDRELKTCDFCLIVVFGPKPANEYLGILKIVPKQQPVTTVLVPKHKIHLPFIVQ